jgi:hypothetical protein
MCFRPVQPGVFDHSISASGIEPLPTRVTAIQDFPLPRTVQNLQAFLGMFNYYRRLIPAAAAVVLPLTNALQGGKKGNAAVHGQRRTRLLQASQGSFGSGFNAGSPNG